MPAPRKQPSSCHSQQGCPHLVVDRGCGHWDPTRGEGEEPLSEEEMKKPSTPCPGRRQIPLSVPEEAEKGKEKVKSRSHVRLFVTPWTVACRLLVHGIFRERILAWGCHFLLQQKRGASCVNRIFFPFHCPTLSLICTAPQGSPKEISANFSSSEFSNPTEDSTLWTWSLTELGANSRY